MCTHTSPCRQSAGSTQQPTPAISFRERTATELIKASRSGALREGRLPGDVTQTSDDVTQTIDDVRQTSDDVTSVGSDATTADAARP